MPHARVLVPVLAAMAVAGGGLAADGVDGAEPPVSGIRGLVVLAPSCPVILERDPCPEPARSVSIVIRRAADRTWVATIGTDARGRFRKALEPGTYLLEWRRPPGPTATKRVRVPRHRVVVVILH
jgi:hypothetical protein